MAMNSYTLPPTSYRRPTDKDQLIIVVDFGNGDVKVMSHGCFGEQVYFPQAVDNPKGTNWDTLRNQYAASQTTFNGSAAFEIPEFEGGYVVGRDAERKGRRMMGAAKYEPQHMIPLLIGALLQIYPRNHPNVRIVATHPQTTTSKQLENFRTVLGRKHVAKMPDGQRIEYKVRSISFITEARAAFNTMVLTQTGQRRKKMPLDVIREGAELLIFDGGSYISSFSVARVTKRGTIETSANDSTPVNAGIENFYTELDKLLRDAIPQLGNQDRLTPRQRREALYYNSITHRGNVINEPVIAEAVTAAMNAFTNEVYRVYSDIYQGGGDYDGMVISGGGGAGAFEHLERLFGHPHITMVEEDLEMMRFGAINGASKTVSAEEGLKSGDSE